MNQEVLTQPVVLASESDVSRLGILRSYVPAAAAVFASLILVFARIYLGGDRFISDGALMMLALMAIVLALGVTGWMQTTDTFFGDEWLMELHEVLANGLLLAAGLHAAAAIVMGRLERVRLVRAMVTGTKQHF